MKSRNIILRSLQSASFIAILLVLSLGFATPVSITQGFILHPLLLLALLGSFVFAESQIDNGKSMAQIHQLPTTKNKFQLPCCKAA